jgi:hypothetical protein
LLFELIAEKILSLDRGYVSMISTYLEDIWKMSEKAGFATVDRGISLAWLRGYNPECLSMRLWDGT